MKKVATLIVMMIAAACAAPPGSDSYATATADLRDASGESVGMATLVERGGEVQITIHATDLPPGVHGVHIHQTGTCTPPDFSSAGGHFAPESHQHGFENPAGPHAGDLPNIEVGADGSGHFTLINDRVTLTSGEASLFDADGSAIVVHAGADDYRTDPAGDSGARIACGVITR